MIRRRSLLAAPLALSGLALPGRARAQDWAPPRTIRLIVPYAPSGGADTTARLLAGPFAPFLGQSVVVENRPGAGATLGPAEVARSAPDGTTLLLDAAGHLVAPLLIRGLNFDYATAFAPISQVTILPQLFIVPANSPHRTLTALLAAAKADPGKLTFGSSGNASAQHIAVAVLLRRAGVEMTHVPYRGGGPAMQALLSGDVDMVIATVTSGAALAREGRVRALAASSAQRIDNLPDVPTVAEQGFPGYEQNEWNGLWGPAGLPAAAVQRLHAACLDALAKPVTRERLAGLGAIGLGTTPADFAAFLTHEREATTKLVREMGITAD